MGPWIEILLPPMLVMARVGAFVSVLPIFGWRSLPLRVRATVALVLTGFFAMLVPPPEAGQVHWAWAGVLIAKESTCGLALGLALRLVFQSVEQGGRFASRQMGFALATVVDPNSGADAQPLSLFFEMTFSLFFVVAGGHHLLIRILAGSYETFPVARGPEIAEMTRGIVQAGSAMLTFALKMAGPLLAASLVMTVVLGILARAVPEMNILLLSFPLRIGTGFLMAILMLPHMNRFVGHLAGWMERLVPT